MDAARAWVDAWEQGWRTHDPKRIAARYADGASFRSHPFREPEDARAYVEQVLAEEKAKPESGSASQSSQATGQPSSTGRSSTTRVASTRSRARRSCGSTTTAW